MSGPLVVRAPWTRDEALAVAKRTWGRDAYCVTDTLEAPSVFVVGLDSFGMFNMELGRGASWELALAAADENYERIETRAEITIRPRRAAAPSTEVPS